ncbi:YdcF family protein [Radicibacter daui]|uniref:YdcF family protein n=1 Tax=Radicibacter daui TaxID=3064829 RepID=UPI004046B525
MRRNRYRYTAERRRWPLLRALFLACIIAAIGWAGGFLWFVTDVQRQAPNPTITTDAIVVLTGGTNRLQVGLDLLENDRADQLFISGVGGGGSISEVFAPRQVPKELVGCCIHLGYLAQDTEGNAREASDWVRDNGFNSIWIVTANYHMRRAMLEFERTLPDVFVMPYPVAPEGLELDEWWNHEGTLRLLVNEYNKLLVALGPAWFRRAMALPKHLLKSL